MAPDASCACRGCCNYPNGRIAIVATLSSVASYLLAINAAYRCNYVTVDLTLGSALDLPDLEDFGFGLWSRESYDDEDLDCTAWSQEEADYFFDASWKTGQAFAILANITGGVAMIVTICMACMSMPGKAIKVVAFMLAMAGIFEVFTFVAFASDICDTYDCTFGGAAGVSIAATVMFFVSSCIVAKIPPYEGREEFAPSAGISSDPPPGSVSVAQTVLPDGTKKTTRTTINADGSKTVEETIEQPSGETPAADNNPSVKAEVFG